MWRKGARQQQRGGRITKQEGADWRAMNADAEEGECDFRHI